MYFIIFQFRDLKPPNILLDHNDVAKLCDFGLARFMLTGTQELTQASLKGTPLYMAPEVINSPVIPPTYNHNADLWYKMITIKLVSYKKSPHIILYINLGHWDV